LENDFHIFFVHFLSIGLSRSFYFLQFHPPWVFTSYQIWSLFFLLLSFFFLWPVF
jgi:hypothetical protein